MLQRMWSSKKHERRFMKRAIIEGKKTLEIQKVSLNSLVINEFEYLFIILTRGGCGRRKVQ